jgi:hypothetical protein
MGPGVTASGAAGDCSPWPETVAGDHGPYIHSVIQVDLGI